MKNNITKDNKRTFDVLKERGYVYQSTNEEMIKEMLNNGEPKTFYLGIDPTADSLHIGYFFALTMVRRLQKMGHHPAPGTLPPVAPND